MAKKLHIQTEITVYEKTELVDATAKQLLKAAQDAALNAYAPYSNFCVGAAVLLENGAVVVGNNQENAAYPSGMCAERVALFSASALYPKLKVKALAIAAFSKKRALKIPVPPCGACRQVMLEYENRQKQPIGIWLGTTQSKVYFCSSASDLLPLSFGKQNLA